MEGQSSSLNAPRKTRFIELFQWIEERVSFPIRHLPIKRLFDIFFSSFLLIALAPIFLLLALLVKLTSKGPIFFSQERVGRGGKPFYCLKFRTMHSDAQKRLQTILKNDPVAREEWQSSYKLKNDPRITKIGNFLRKTSLDELPQFFNVLKGDLSVVGPRAVVEEELRVHFKEKSRLILSVRPGLTGDWQTSGRNNISYAERVSMDKDYVENLSLKKDLKLIARTIPVMLFARGAY